MIDFDAEGDYEFTLEDEVIAYGATFLVSENAA